MKRFEMVKLERDFNNIINNGHYIKNSYFVIYNKENNINKIRFGLAVGKKMGNAVTRNKLKRQLRVIIDNNKKFFNNGIDYIIMIKGAASKLSFAEMNKELSNLIGEIK